LKDYNFNFEVLDNENSFTAAEGIIMGAAMTFDGPSATDHQRKLNDAARAEFSESLNIATNGSYDTVYMLKAGIEKAQSIDPKDIAAALPSVKFRTFYGGETGFGGKEDYGSAQQPILPVYVTQIVGGKLVEKARIQP
jgi:branched-chain amino acid transport system substrate-binding protein